MKINFKKYLPNILTFARGFFSPFAILIELTKSDIAQFCFLLVLVFSDQFDGYLARKYKITEKLGSQLEDISDFIFGITLSIVVNLRFNLFSWPNYFIILLMVLVLTFIPKFINYKLYVLTRNFHKMTYPLLFTGTLLAYSIKIGYLVTIFLLLYIVITSYWKRERIITYVKKFFEFHL